jgi:undecaprenyl-diphosphatase
MIGLDHRVEHWIVTHRVAALDDAFVWLSRVGALGLVWIVLGAVLAVALRRPAILLIVVAADLAAALSASGLRAIVGRPRPDEAHRLVDASGFSFPSGHAATSVACAVVLAIAIPRLAGLFLALAAAIAFSRLYVGVHYPLDVVAGAALGVAVATALLLLVRGRRGSPTTPR